MGGFRLFLTHHFLRLCRTFFIVLLYYRYYQSLFLSWIIPNIPRSLTSLFSSSPSPSQPLLRHRVLILSTDPLLSAGFGDLNGTSSHFSLTQLGLSNYLYWNVNTNKEIKQKWEFYTIPSLPTLNARNITAYINTVQDHLHREGQYTDYILLLSLFNRHSLYSSFDSQFHTKDEFIDKYKESCQLYIALIRQILHLEGDRGVLVGTPIFTPFKGKIITHENEEEKAEGTTTKKGGYVQIQQFDADPDDLHEDEKWSEGEKIYHSTLHAEMKKMIEGERGKDTERVGRLHLVLDPYSYPQVFYNDLDNFRYYPRGSYYSYTEKTRDTQPLLSLSSHGYIALSRFLSFSLVPIFQKTEWKVWSKILIKNGELGKIQGGRKKLNGGYGGGDMKYDGMMMEAQTYEKSVARRKRVGEEEEEEEKKWMGEGEVSGQEEDNDTRSKSDMTQSVSGAGQVAN